MEGGQKDQVNKEGARFKTYQVSSWADGLML